MSTAMNLLFNLIFLFVCMMILQDPVDVTIQAFAFHPSPCISLTRFISSSTTSTAENMRRTRLFSTSEDPSSTSPPTTEDVTVVNTNEKETPDESAGEEQEKKNINSVMDEIKTEISQLEQTLKNKRRELASIEGLVEQYSKAGYARKVAEMDGFRKNKQAAQLDDKSALKAFVLQDFLPILERLNELNQQYASNPFAVKNYSTLSTSFASTLKTLGLVEYVPNVGTKVKDYDAERIKVVQEEGTDLYPEGGFIMSILKKGYELNGNIVQPAHVVVSSSTGIGSTGIASIDAAVQESTESSKQEEK